MRFGKSNEDPGGSREPVLHEGLAHRPIVKITNRKIEVVQLTPHVSYPAAQAVHLRLQQLLSERGLVAEVEGVPRVVGMNGGMLRREFGHNGGARMHAFPVAFSPKENAAQMEGSIQKAIDEFRKEVPEAEMHGFVGDANEVICSMLAEEAAKARSILAVGDTVPRNPSVELPHENPAGHGQQGEADRDGVGAESARA